MTPGDDSKPADRLLVGLIHNDQRIVLVGEDVSYLSRPPATQWSADQCVAGRRRSRNMARIRAIRLNHGSNGRQGPGS